MKVPSCWSSSVRTVGREDERSILRLGVCPKGPEKTLSRYSLEGLELVRIVDTEWFRVVAPRFVAGVEVQDGVIIRTAPILSRFKGQDLHNLEVWVKSIGGCVEVLLSESVPDAPRTPASVLAGDSENN